MHSSGSNKTTRYIQISQARLQQLPLDGEMPNIQTIEYTNNTTHQNDKGPANEQTDIGDIDGVTHSSVLLHLTLEIKYKILSMKL